VEECFNDADDYDLAGLEYEEIVGTINEIENVENANVPVHKSKLTGRAHSFIYDDNKST
jgi:hypothetical protein